MQAGFLDGVGRSARVLAEELVREGFRLVSGGTDNHLVLVDVGARGLTGKKAEEFLGEAGITVNKNTIPFDTRGAKVASGIRLGSPAVTTRGMKEGEMRLIARLVGGVLLRQVPPARVRAQVEELCASFPLYPELWDEVGSGGVCVAGVGVVMSNDRTRGVVGVNEVRRRLR